MLPAEKQYRETVRAFELQNSTVRKICKAGPLKISKYGGFKGGKAWKWNGKGPGRPLSYPASVVEGLLSWILIMNHLHMPLSVLALQKKAKSLILPYNNSFDVSIGWICQFKEKHLLSLCKRTSLCQRLPSQLEGKDINFRKIGKYQFPSISNMDYTSVFLTWCPRDH